MYRSFWEPISGLSDEQLGRLLRAIYAYQSGEEPQLDGEIAMAFKFMRRQFELDGAKYRRKCENLINNTSSRNRDESVTKSEKESRNRDESGSENENENENEREFVSLSRARVREAETDTDREKQKIFESFFIRGFADPIAETNRFWAHYAARGWKFGDGLPVEDKLAASQKWKPDKEGGGPPVKVRQYLMAVYKAMIRDGSGPVALYALVRAAAKGQDLELTYRDGASAEMVMHYIDQHKMRFDWNLRFRKAQ